MRCLNSCLLIPRQAAERKDIDLAMMEMEEYFSRLKKYPDMVERAHIGTRYHKLG